MGCEMMSVGFDSGGWSIPAIETVCAGKLDGPVGINKLAGRGFTYMVCWGQGR